LVYSPLHNMPSDEDMAKEFEKDGSKRVEDDKRNISQIGIQPFRIDNLLGTAFATDGGENERDENTREYPEVDTSHVISSHTSRSVASMRGALVAAFDGPENIIIKDDLPAPEITAPNQVLIDVHTAGINPVDTYIRSGAYGKLIPLPYIPGREGCGIVREVGSDVEHVKAGDRVCVMKENGITTKTTVATTVFPFRMLYRSSRVPVWACRISPRTVPSSLSEISRHLTVC
ncbi:hypothetical protein PRIPAC_85828, partial [Pristionchus pacificus]